MIQPKGFSEFLFGRKREDQMPNVASPVVALESGAEWAMVGEGERLVQGFAKVKAT